jgi:hypothetical protein
MWSWTVKHESLRLRLLLAIILFVYLAVSRWVVRPLDTLVTSSHCATLTTGPGTRTRSRNPILFY